MKKSLLFVTPSAYPLGGVAVWMQYIAIGLEHLGWDVTIGLVNNEYHQAEKYLKEYSFEKILLINNPSVTRYGRVIAISDAIRKKNPDIVLSVNIPDVFDAVSLCKKSGSETKAVMTLHGLQADLFKDISIFEDKIDAVIVTNMLTKLMLQEHSKFDVERLFYAPYGVRVNHGPCFRKYNKSICILFAGRIEQSQKRCQDLLLIAKEMERRELKYDLMIVGDGPDRKQIINELNLIVKVGRINYLGYINNQKFKAEILPKADALILTSYWETGPIIIWEAMAAGVLVITSRYIGSGVEKALIDNKNSLMFNVGDAETAVNQIEKVLDKKLVEKIKKEAYQLVKTRYSENASVESWNLVLSSIVDNVRAKKSCDLGVNTWIKNGLIEKVFGHKVASLIRPIIGRPGYAQSAGDEWPHTYGYVTDFEEREFINTLDKLDETPVI